MKKFCIFVFLCITVFACSFNNSFFEYLAKLDGNAKISFYCTEKNNGDFLSEVRNGEGYVYELKGTEAQSAYSDLLGCYGFSVKLDKKLFEEVMQNVKVLKTETVAGIENFYGIANGIMFFDFLEDKKINIQIAKSDDAVVVGCPLILGSY